MSPILTLKNISKLYGVRIIIKNASFLLHEGEKVALVGANGVGKSTLLKIISKNTSYDTGMIELRRGARIGYLEQEIDTKETKTVGEYLKKVLGEKFNDRKIEIYIPMFFKGFGLDNINFKTLISKMSGGERSKLALVALLLGDADILLLDEPTNNLDLSALLWLEEYIRESKKSAIIVSHDRRFLDDVVSRVLEIDWFKREVISFVGNHTQYLSYKIKAFEKQKFEYHQKEEKKKRLLLAIQKKKEHVAKSIKYGTGDRDKMAAGYHKNRATRNLSSQSKAIETRISQLPHIDKPVERMPLFIEIGESTERAKPSIHLLKAVGGYSAFKLGPISLEIPFGRRIGILGKNGSGKSTLIKMISGDQKLLKGERKIGPSLIFGNLTQAHENLPRDKSLLDYIEEETGFEREFVFNILKKYGFDSVESGKPISRLSPGGRSRLLISGFAARSVNVLLLDEPTNHLDEPAIQALSDVLETFKGTVVLVSHDRAFLDQARLDYIYLVEDGQLKQISNASVYEKQILRDVKKAQSLLKSK